MTDTADNAPESTENVGSSTSNADVVAQAVAEQTEAGTDFGFVLDKYRAEGRSDSDAAFEQAKAYTELQSKFGSFTGAPEEYELALSEELGEKFNTEDLSDDPIYNDFKDIAKELNLNQDGFNQLAELYIKGQLADVQAMDEIREQEMKALGNNADRRLGNIQDWAKANLDAEGQEGLLDMLTSAKSVQAVEQLIAKSRNSAQVQDTPAAPAIDSMKLKEMMVAKDDYGNSKMNDPAYRAQVNKLYDQVYGAEPHNVIIGQ